MATVTQSDNSGNSASADGIEMDEFLPIVKFKNPSTYPEEYGELVQSDEEVTLSRYLDADKRTFKMLSLTTEEKQLRLTFTIKKGGSGSWDDDGHIEVKLSIQDKAIKLVSPSEVKVKYDSEIDVDIEWEGDLGKECYIDFYANDDEDDFLQGNYEDVHCGRLKVVFEGPNEWEFSKEKISVIKNYAIQNNSNFRSRGNSNRYHHCTDTHKHIIYKLLDSPSVLTLGKNQDHEANRLTPKDFEKAGESTTAGIRNLMISTTYAESSTTFTVLDNAGSEVLTSSGKPGTTDLELKGFKESPIEYMKDKCPDDGNYVFIGAYNDDYHSFTILVNKKNNSFTFNFIDQMVGVKTFTGNSLENSKLLDEIDRYRADYPMKLELYQLRNKRK